MDFRNRTVDPITFEILSHRLHQIAKETGITLERVGGTVNTTQMHDYAAALYRANGEILSAGETTGWHVACAGLAVKKIMERFNQEGEIEADDLFILNDPYLAAIHQSDVYMVCPIHFKGRLVGWSGTFVHVMDIGAMSPGGDSPGATEIFHEGLRIPGLKLVERGKLRRDVFDTITHMTRQPIMVGLDLKCQIAANNVAKSRLQEMYAEYGPELVDGVSADMVRYSESVLRKRITEIGDGSWSETNVIQGEENWKITVKLTKKADTLIFDFTGTDKQARRGINLPYHATFGACFRVVLFSLAYDIPKNHGVLQPIEVIAPTGTIVNVQYPGPVSLNTTSSGSMVRYLASSVLMQALATSEKWRKEVMAISAGHRNLRHAGVNQYGRYAVSALGHGALDGTGARSYQDGVNSWGGHLSCANVEWFEMNFPVLYLFRRHARDAAGAGTFRGGAGAETAHILHDAPEERVKGVTYGVSSSRNSGQGIFGGRSAAPSVIVHLEETNVLDRIEKRRPVEEVSDLGGRAAPLAYKEFDFRSGDVVYMRVASGGGYGDPLERDPQMVLADVIDGIVSQKAAREVYGVVLNETTEAVDWTATKSLRAAVKNSVR
ncbi:MAG TPA: hydantoinase B/oxoprolinase family protein [Candidatus Binatia bacterium]|nr:hydantoinase B/oxoprolinase family protein [Candidatus Binatia bacterium]